MCLTGQLMNTHCVLISRTRSTQTPQNPHFSVVMSTHSTKSLCSPRRAVLVTAHVRWNLSSNADIHHGSWLTAQPWGLRVGVRISFPLSVYTQTALTFTQTKTNPEQHTLTREVLLPKPEYPGYHSFIRLREVTFLNREQSTIKLFHFLSRLDIISATSLITPWQSKIYFHSF